eukprot:CAMPEP_0184479632 /NCGR_PEP_ID=MMETSP0113_2-20130426/1281_1 /TAXON_ID=91329 /ORGANISM="Norrisiella sphaerica, Strain BC52" /LENGTH=597 /DNA_ID=CAMNT_0026857753 /DNA_START=393 /DNA_END=2183 /DNA_ORIENTATION=-
MISYTEKIYVIEAPDDDSTRFYVTYFVEWITATPMMILAVFHFDKTSPNRRILLIRALLLNFASLTMGQILWRYPSFFTFVPTTYPFLGFLYTQDRLFKEMRQNSKDQEIISKFLRGAYAIGWTSFPAVYALTRLGFLSLEKEPIHFGYCDLVTKLGLVMISFNLNNVYKEELVWLNKVLEQEQMKRDVVRYIFHEARVPLNTITLGVENLDPNDENAFTATKKSIADSCDSMRHILDDYLIWEKMRSNRFELEKEKFLLAEVTDMIQDRFKETADAKNIKFVVENHHKSIAVQGDKHRIVQVGSNFVSNALKFTPENGIVKYSISVIDRAKANVSKALNGDGFISEGEKKENSEGSKPVEKKLQVIGADTGKNCLWIRFACQDNGIGISKTNQQKLFQPFVQISPGELQGGAGSGLGLSICREMAKRMGGGVGLESSLGKGSMFFMDIPMPKASIIRVLEEENDMPILEQKVRVLITDDVKTNREFLAKRLNRVRREVDNIDFLCTVAAGGQEAIDKSINRGSYPYHVYLMDNQMPGMLGREAIKELRNIGIKSLIIGVTGDVTSEDKKLMLEHGADYVHPKPVKVSALLKTIKSW